MWNWKPTWSNRTNRTFRLRLFPWCCILQILLNLRSWRKSSTVKSE